MSPEPYGRRGVAKRPPSLTPSVETEGRGCCRVAFAGAHVGVAAPVHSLARRALVLLAWTPRAAREDLARAHGWAGTGREKEMRRAGVSGPVSPSSRASPSACARDGDAPGPERATRIWGAMRPTHSGNFVN